MMPVKADPAICSSAIGVSARSVAFMSSHYLDFSSCGIVPGFCNQSGHIYRELPVSIVGFYYDVLICFSESAFLKYCCLKGAIKHL